MGSLIMRLSSGKAVLAFLALAATAEQAIAQMTPAQPYAGLQRREIKSLSGEEITQLRRGEGMGLALAAELNGYPGPRHVLDLSTQLALTDQQHTRIQQLFDQMKTEALPLGQQLIAAESDLNRAFVEQAITPERLKAAVDGIAAIQGKLRDIHLKYHLSTAALLSPDQIRQYADLRGYTAVANAPDAPEGSHGMAAGAMHQHVMGVMRGE